MGRGVLGALSAAVFVWAASCGGTDSGDGPNAPPTCDQSCPSGRVCSSSLGCVECFLDADCGAGNPACIDGRCGCSSDADCAGGTNVDTCVAGSCGCSSTAACTDPIFDNVTQVCDAA